MHLTQPVPAALLESAPVGLLHLDPRGRIAIVNPRALDLLGRSVFDCLDHTVEDVLGVRPGATPTALPGRDGLVATLAHLAPPFAGELVALGEAHGTAPDDDARVAEAAQLAQVEAALDRAASAMPRSAPALARHEMVRALAELRRFAHRHDHVALTRLLACGDTPPATELALSTLVREALVARAAEIRLTGIEVTLATVGAVDARGHAGLARVAIDDLLDVALEAAGPDGTVAIRLEGDAAWARVRIETAVATASAGARRAEVAREATLDRVCQVAELIGGRLERDLVPPSLAALVLPASPVSLGCPART